MKYNRAKINMKRIVLFLLAIMSVNIALCQYTGNKLLSVEQKKRCETDKDYLSNLANEGYPEAEYLLAMTIYVDIYDATYKKYWASYDPNNNFVGAAHWFKKACEHGWIEAYDTYAEFCFYGRGNAVGGTMESIKWLQKLVDSQPKNLTAIANIGICYIKDRIYEKGYDYLLSAYGLWEHDTTLKINSEIIMDIALLNYYGFIDVEYDGKEICSSFLVSELLSKPIERFSDYGKGKYGYTDNYKKAFIYVIHYYNQISDEKSVSFFLNTYNKVFKRKSGVPFDISWVESEFNKYSSDSKCDFYFL